MPSTYTLNNGIELIATGEQSGTWGDTTNTNMSLLDTALDGQVTVTLASAGTSGSPNTLPISDGAVSDGRNRMVIFNDGADLGATAYVQLTPNDAEKIVYIRNALSGSRSIIVFQGTYNASNDYEIPAGATAVIYFNGGGTGAVAANVFNNAHFDALNIVGAAAVGTTLTVGTSLNIASSTTVDGVLDEDNMSSDSPTKLATQQSIKAYVDSQVTAQDLDFAGDSGTGAVDLDSQTFTISGTTNEIETAASGQTLTVGLPGNVTITTSLTTPTVKASNIDANDGTAAINIADSTGAVDIDTSLNVDGLIEGDQLRVGGTLGNFDVSAGGNQATFDYNGFNYINSTGAGSALVVRMGSGSTNAIRFDSDGKVIVNDDGNDTDFRVESDTNANAFFVDAGNSSVGINTNAPSFGTGNGLEIYNSESGIGVGGGTLRLTRGDVSTAVDDPIGTIEFYSKDADGAHISAFIQSTAQETYARQGDLIFGTAQGVSVDAVEATRINNFGALVHQKAAVFNESGVDADFRVESGSNDHMLFVNAGLDQVVIGSGTISAPSGYHLLSYGAGSDARSAFVHGAGDGGIVVSGAAGGSAANVIFGNNWGSNGATFSEEYRIFMDGADDSLKFNYNANASTAMELASNGFVSIGGDSPLTPLHVKYSAAGELLRLESTDAGAGLGPTIGLFRNSASPAPGDNLGAINFYGEDNVSNITTYAAIESETYGVTNGSETGRLHFKVAQSASLVSRFYMNFGETVVNESGENIDFRVESDSVANMFLVDAANNRVGVGTGNPAYTFVVSNSGAEGLEISAGGISANRQNIISYNRSGAAYNALWIDASNIVMQPPGGGGGSVNIGDSDTTIAKLNVKGEVGGNIARFRSGDTYQGFDFSGETTYGNGTVAITPNTIPGSGTANMWTHFATAGTGPGYTIHNVRIDGELETDRSTTFNQGGNDFDFRVESDSNAYAFFLDAGNNVIGTGTSTPATYVDSGGLAIKGAAASDLSLVASSVASGVNSHQIRYWNEAGASYEIARTRVNVGAGQVNRGEYQFAVNNGAGLRQWLDVDYLGNVKFNDGSYDSDFRVESDSNANMLLIDASTNQVMVGIGTAPINRTFYVESQTYPCQLRMGTSAVNYPVLQLRSGYVTGGQTGTQIDFRDGADNSVGTISSTVSGTAYNTTSDARLKENIADAEDAGVKVDAIQVRQFDWKADGSHQDYGMVAQELIEVAPEAVTGEPDGEEMMGVDYSKLVPMLVKEIQSLRERVAQLESN